MALGPYYAAFVSNLHYRRNKVDMPRIPPLTNEDSGDARDSLERLEIKLGQVPNMYRTLAHAPKVLDAVVAMGQAIRSDLDPRLRELAYLKVTQMTNCHV